MSAQPNMEKKTLLIVGGGAAGFFCAVNAARLNSSLKVIIIEKTGKLLSKVKVSGGGRCNVTHSCFEVDEMIRNYPRGEKFLKRAFFKFSTKDTIEWFESRGVKLKTEEDGRIFPVSDDSQTVIDCLIHEAKSHGVSIWMNTEVRSIQKAGQKFIVRLTAENEMAADIICLACGGFPKDRMFDWLRSMAISIVSPVPSLFTFNIPGNDITRLMGVSVIHTRVKIPESNLSAEGPLLITHWGMSGPVILRLSAWGARTLASSASGKGYQFKIQVNWLPSKNESLLRQDFLAFRHEAGQRKIFSRCPFPIPQRLWEWILLQSGITENIRWAELASAAQHSLIKNLLAQEFQVDGKTTFKEEFVTAGGVSLSEIDPQTMQSKKIPGLFFAGEIMDVDGITGGFNFQHAWTSGFIAAKSIAQL
jgi:predicted Rossmann fold flavoprotein